MVGWNEFPKSTFYHQEPVAIKPTEKRCKDCKWVGVRHNKRRDENESYFCHAYDNHVVPSGGYCREQELVSYTPKLYIRIINWWKGLKWTEYKKQ